MKRRQFIGLLTANAAAGLPAASAVPKPPRAYSEIRGFNFQPPWGSNGRDVWQDRFDPDEYRRIIRLAKKAFPKLNCLRVWLSFDAWYDGRDKATANVRRAGEIIASEGLKMIPVYFNGWHSIPDFGGFTHEQLGIAENRDWQPFRRYLAETAAALEGTGAVLMGDLSNEPLNNTQNLAAFVPRVRNFMFAMAEELRRHSARPVTIGSQGYRFPGPVCGAASDLELFAGAVDVFSIHPYSVCMAPKARHLEHVEWLVSEADRLGKPILVTECCWDDDGDKARGDIVALELANYAKAGIGFLVHALSPSRVADLHPKDGVNPGFTMHFMDLKGAVRPYHDVFNRY